MGMEDKMMKKEFRLMVAPLQGLTEAVWRNVHHRHFGDGQGEVEYFTPFIRVDRDEVRARDLRDFTSELNEGMMLTPQIIFRDMEEWKRLVEMLIANGAKRIDMNMGCPFPPQVKKGRGAGMIMHPDAVGRIAEEMANYPEVQFSVKMRLGVVDPSEALALVDILNAMPLRHVTIHPRTAKQQYKGEFHLKEMAELSSCIKHPVIFNGEISSPSDIEALSAKYDGVMVGRGLLARPSLFAEYRAGKEWSVEEREEAFLGLIEGTYKLLENSLCGSTQIRDKMKPYWEYAPNSLDRKIVKFGKKNGYIWS